MHTTSGITAWQLQNGTLTRSLNLFHVDFTDVNHGWAGGEDGLLHTSDGGATWEGIQDSGYCAISLAAVDEQTAWACVGLNCYLDYWKALHRTTNGGTTWETVVPGEFVDPRLVARYGTAHVWVLGWLNPDPYHDSLVVCRSVDAGESWECFDLGEGWSYPQDMFFADENHGWFVTESNEGLYGQIYHTGNGGQTWQLQFEYSASGFSDISFVDAMHGWVSGWSDGLVRTTDGGAQWDLMPSPEWGLRGIEFLDTLNGWAFSGWSGESFRTTDGGNTWERFETGVDVSLEGMTFADFNHGWLVGISGAILHYDGTGSTAPEKPAVLPERLTLSVHPNPFNETTTLTFTLPIASRVELALYDLLGRQVRTVLNEVRAAGEHHVSWDASGLASGIYFVRMTPLSPPVNGGRFESQTRKVVLLK